MHVSIGYMGRKGVGEERERRKEGRGKRRREIDRGTEGREAGCEEVAVLSLRFVSINIDPLRYHHHHSNLPYLLYSPLSPPIFSSIICFLDDEIRTPRDDIHSRSLTDLSHELVISTLCLGRYFMFLRGREEEEELRWKMKRNDGEE